MRRDNEMISMTAQQLLDNGLHCYNVNDFEGAAYYFENLLTVESDNVDLLFTLVNIHQNLLNYDRALFYSNKAISKKPDEPQLLLKHAEIHCCSHNYESAQLIYIKLSNEQPLNLYLLERLFFVYTMTDQWERVKKTQALHTEITKNKLRNEEVESTIKVVTQLIEQEKNEEAKTLLNSILLVESYNIKANGLLGAILKDEGNFEQALLYFDKIAYYLDFHHFLDSYTYCISKVRENVSVIKYLKARSNCYPQEHKSLYLLGLYLYKVKSYKDSYSVLSPLEKNYNHDIKYLKCKAMALFLFTRKDNSANDLSKLYTAAKELSLVHDLLPEDYSVTISLVKCYLNIGERKKAYDVVCSSEFPSEELREWNKRSYYNATKNRDMFYNSELNGRAVRSYIYASGEYNELIWNGECLKGKNVAILNEQGIGDEILFASNYGWIIKEAKYINIFCSARLNSEFSRLFPSVTFHSLLENNNKSYMTDEQKKIIEKADYVILACDLAALHYQKFGVPLYQQNYYYINEDKKSYWSNVLRDLTGNNRLNVGIIWRSGKVNVARSIHALKVEDVSFIINSLPEVNFINCMYSECCDEVGIINKLTNGRLHVINNLDQKNDFENTAAMISSLDLFLGAYTAPLSLANAVGTPTIVFAPDYLKEDDVYIKSAINYEKVTHISIPVNDLPKKNIALEKLIFNIRVLLGL